jgi:hypothetical protein
MTNFSRLLAMTVLIGLAAIGICRPAAAAMQTPASLQALVGSWSCTYTGPKGTAKSTYTISRVGDLWVEGSGHTGAYPGRPANTSFFMIGYDPKKQMYVSMGGSTIAGDYGISTASAGPNAMTMTYVNNYPADPTHEKDVWNFSTSTLSIASTWTEKGKAMSSKGSCTKQ